MKKVVHNLWRAKAPSCIQDIIEWRTNGIILVICLQEGWSWLGKSFKAERLWEMSGADYHKQAFSNFFPPTYDECEQLSRMIDKQATLVHCKAGVDRTGFLCSYYLATRTDITMEAAWEYAIKEGMHWWYKILWKRAFFKAAMEHGKNLCKANV